MTPVDGKIHHRSCRLSCRLPQTKPPNSPHHGWCDHYSCFPHVHSLHKQGRFAPLEFPADSKCALPVDGGAALRRIEAAAISPFPGGDFDHVVRRGLFLPGGGHADVPGLGPEFAEILRPQVTHAGLHPGDEGAEHIVH
jgi:hypothetical protein